jgi:hypothetical protein
MNEWLRKLAILVGCGLLIISIFWSQEGFNFSLAGSSGGGNFALFFGWFIAFSVCVIQFVFSTNFKELNSSLLFFGALAYVYSIYTNYQGIIHFQGLEPSPIGAGILAVFIDAVPEPLIAWGLYESMQGDLIGNLMKWVNSSPQKSQGQNHRPNQQPSRDWEQRIHDKTQDRQQRHNQLRNKQTPNIPPFLRNRED